MNKSWWQQFEGQVIDNTYRLVRLIGTGGFGGVFLSDHVVEGTFVRHVAVKLVVCDADQMQRQLAELVTATTLRHPSLLSCFHAGATTFANIRLLYLVMELADEGLGTRLEKGILPISESLELTRNLAQGLAYLHERRIVHRDVKPANILRVESAWKLSDFGTVRQSSDTTSRTNVIIGSMAYMPPESFDGIVSPAWDMWSLGVLLLRALTGQPAYAETSEHQLIRAILDTEPAIPENLSAPFSDIVRGCLVKDYRGRWSAGKVMSALEAPRRSKEPVLALTRPTPVAVPYRQTANEHESVPAVGNLPYRAVEDSERSRRPLVFAIAVLAVTCVVGYVALSPSRSGLPEKNASPATKNRDLGDKRSDPAAPSLNGLSKIEQDRMNSGLEALRKKQYAEAVEYFQQVLSSSPKFVDGHLLLGRVYMEQYIPGAATVENVGFANQAEAAFMKALALDARNKTALAALGELKYSEVSGTGFPKERSARLAQAKHWTEKLIEVDPRNEVAHYSLGVFDWQDAWPQLMAARVQIGMDLNREGPLRDQRQRKRLQPKIGPVIDDGIQHLTQALQIAPNYDDAMAYLSLCLRERADLADSKDDYRRDVAEADRWMHKALDTVARRTAGTVPPKPSSWSEGPPPLPPPPPPPKQQSKISGE